MVSFKIFGDWNIFDAQNEWWVKYVWELVAATGEQFIEIIFMFLFGNFFATNLKYEQRIVDRKLLYLIICTWFAVKIRERIATRIYLHGFTWKLTIGLIKKKKRKKKLIIKSLNFYGRWIIMVNVTTKLCLTKLASLISLDLQLRWLFWILGIRSKFEIFEFVDFHRFGFIKLLFLSFL